MKNFYFLSLLFLTAFFLPAVAGAETPLKVDIDDVSRVDVDVDGTVQTNLKNGVNEFVGSYIRVIAKEGISFTEVTLIDNYYKEETSWMNRVDVINGRQYVDLHSNFPEDEEFRIRTSGAADVRTATCMVTVDDPSRVKLMRKSTESEIELVGGVATAVKFDPNNENEFILTPTDDKPLYKVLHNDVEVESGGYSYTIPVADGDNINIMANYPDVDCTLKFVFADQNAIDFIRTVDLDDKPVLNYADGTVQTKLGAGLRITGDTDNYEIVSFSVNGQSVPFFNPFQLLIEGDTEIAISVREYASFPMIINVDDPSRVHVFQGYHYNGVEYPLKSGDNEVKVLRDYPFVSIVPSDGAYIASVKIGEDEYAQDELRVAPIMVSSLAENEVLEITSGIIVRDKKAVVYLENKESAAGFFKMMRADKSEITDFVEGYNQLDFYFGDNSFIMEHGGPVGTYVYINNEKQSPEYPEAPTYRLTLEEMDVMKVFFGDEPKMYSFKLEAEDAVKNSYSLMRDRMIDATSEIKDAVTIQTLQNTELVLTTAVSVALDGKLLAPDEEGGSKYTIKVDGDHTVSLSDQKGSVNALESDDNRPVIYYNLQGIRIDEPAKGQMVLRVCGGHAEKIVIE